jgi:pimeloyl-ACP methyl ester carboxylesterase
VKRLTRLAALLFAILPTLALIADTAPSPDVVSGLRRAPSLGAGLNAPEGPPTIRATAPGSTAEKMALQPGDVILTVDGQSVADAQSFVAAIGKKRAGDRVTITLRRGSETVTKEGTLGAQPLEKRAEYDVEYGSVDAGGSKRRTIVTHPRTPGKHPAVLLLGGIGCYSLDGLLRPAELQQPYALILDALTRNGYATMRVEKSGMGDSEGPPCSDPRSDFDAEVRGYAAGLERLESLDFVDRGNIFLFAHSIGPLDAARIASEHPVRGIVVAETIGTSWLEYDLTNVRRQLLLAGVPYDEADRRVRKHEICAHRYFVEKQRTPECSGEIQEPAPYTYMQQLGSLDLAPLWKKIDAPVLIFYGTADFITDDYQAQYLRDMINAFHPGRATYIKVEGMDHGLTLTGTQKASLEGTSDAPFAQKIVEETLRFLSDHATSRSAP